MVVCTRVLSRVWWYKGMCRLQRCVTMEVSSVLEYSCTMYNSNNLWPSLKLLVSFRLLGQLAFRPKSRTPSHILLRRDVFLFCVRWQALTILERTLRSNRVSRQQANLAIACCVVLVLSRDIYINQCFRTVLVVYWLHSKSLLALPCSQWCAFRHCCLV